MKCPECGMDNAEKNKFCGNCGGALGDASVADLFESAFKSEARGDLDAALEAYGRLLEKRPKSEEILFKTGMVCYELGRVDVAIEKFQQVIEQNPRFVYAHFPPRLRSPPTSCPRCCSSGSHNFISGAWRRPPRRFKKSSSLAAPKQSPITISVSFTSA